MKAAPDKTFFFLRTVKFLGHIEENNTLRPIHSKIESIKRLKTPENKKDLMRFVGAMNFYSNYIYNLKSHHWVIPNKNKPFYIIVDASGHGLGAVLFQANDLTGKMQVISFNSRLLTTTEQRNPIMYKQIMAINFALQVYAFLIVGSEYPITIFSDHRPLVGYFQQK